LARSKITLNCNIKLNYKIKRDGAGQECPAHTWVSGPHLLSGVIMAGMFSDKTIDRRSALVTLGSAGLGLLAMQWAPLYAVDFKSESLSKILPQFNDKSREQLLRVVKAPDFTGHIPASAVTSLAGNERKTVEELMVALLPLARTYARPPISNYLVGAVARGISGSLYLGANIEFPGHSLGFSVHGEQSALSNAYMHSDQGVSAIAVTAAPCGHCRQFMKELSPESDFRILIAGSPATTLSALLPMAFGPKNLPDFKSPALPVREVNLARPKGISDDLTLAALDAARKSYAPYTKAHSGIAIATQSGRIHKGAYIENVAFNPSLSPLQTALAALIVAGDDMSAIARLVLVETENAKISQKSVTEAALTAIAPSAVLHVIKTTMAG
jgi:cytidine deaminase